VIVARAPRAGSGLTDSVLLVAVRVVVADESLLTREGVQHLLENDDAVELVAVCTDAPSLLEAVQREQPDVVLADTRMLPEHDLRERHPEVAFVVLSQVPDARDATVLLENGAGKRGYLLKDRLAGGEQLVRALEDVAAGGSAIDPKGFPTSGRSAGA
jgi:DNA-binding NarL/FixJ family response regulator